MAKLLAKILVPILIIGAFWYVFYMPYTNWSGVKYFVLAAVFAIYLAVVLRGRLRDVSVVVASIMIGLAGINAYSVITQARPIDYRPLGYSVSRPNLGWGPGHPGVFHQKKLYAKTHHVIFDVHYTITKNLLRKVISAKSGPTVAFFGGSFIFGTGLNDMQTLPQVFADLYDRKIRVLNFGFPGYGPSQFLRAIETNMYDKLLHKQTRLVIYETAAWHAQRTSCRAGWVLRAPRYVMVHGKPTYRGACYQHWSTALQELLANMALYRTFVEPALGGPSHADIKLYIAILARAAQLVKEKYGAPTVVLYIRTAKAYLRDSGYTDTTIMQSMRKAGLDVIDATLNPKDFPGKPLSIPGDGHPSATANVGRAALAKAYIGKNLPNLLTVPSN